MSINTETNVSEPDLASPIDMNLEPPSPWKRWAKWLVLGIAALVVLFLIFGGSGTKAPKCVTQEGTRGDLRVTVTATGNLEPRNQVDIGSELSGTIRSVHVDVNDEVEAGQVLAVLDTTR